MQAASFDCDGAPAASADGLVCASSQLNALDVRLTGIYSRVLAEASTQDAGQAIRQQRDWTKRVRNACTTADCLEDAYTSRLWELVQLLKPFECEQRAQSPLERNACKRQELDGLDRDVQTTHQALMQQLQKRNVGTNVKQLATHAQLQWRRYKASECAAQYESAKDEADRSQAYFACNKQLSQQRLDQLHKWMQ